MVKGETFRFSTKVRSARGYGSFQLVFSTESNGLHVANTKKWTAGDFYFEQQTQNDKIILDLNKLKNGNYLLHLVNGQNSEKIIRQFVVVK